MAHVLVAVSSDLVLIIIRSESSWTANSKPGETRHINNSMLYLLSEAGAILALMI
jgi:hypothetical protein